MAAFQGSPQTRSYPSRVRPTRRGVHLQAPGWTALVRRKLETLIQMGSGQHLPVTFDFDNTIVAGDIGEATMAVLARRRRLTTGSIPATLSPSFRNSQGRLVNLQDPPDITAYYEHFGAPTVHGPKDPTPLANAYTWAVEAMQSLPLLDLLDATLEAMDHSRDGSLPQLVVTPGVTSYPAPFFHPEMTELIAELLRHKFQVWVVSASNVWSVRCLVLGFLNPLLRQQGLNSGIAPDRVIGASTLLINRQHQLLKDSVLVRESPAYANLNRKTLSRYALTSRLQFPVPTYSGKVGAIWDAIGRHPFLAAGDSPGDHAMLTFSHYRLWIARLDKPSLQSRTLQIIRNSDPDQWLIQPVLLDSSPGFVPDLKALRRRVRPLPASVKSAVRHLKCFFPD